MNKRLIVVLVILTCCAFIASCGPMKWTHTGDPTFSFSIPNNSAPDKRRFDTEVVRYGSTLNSYRLPTYAASVFPKPEGFTLSDAGEFVINDFQTSYPDASRFKILEQKSVTLDDGSEATAIELKWKWVDRTNVLKTASVVAVKDDKVIHFSGTTIYAGGTSMEELMKNVMTLQLQ